MTAILDVIFPLKIFLFKGRAPKLKITRNYSYGVREFRIVSNSNFKSDIPSDNNLLVQEF